jgi:hypothetical protein
MSTRGPWRRRHSPSWVKARRSTQPQKAQFLRAHSYSGVTNYQGCASKHAEGALASSLFAIDHSVGGECFTYNAKYNQLKLQLCEVVGWFSSRIDLLLVFVVISPTTGTYGDNRNPDTHLCSGMTFEIIFLFGNF